jgi:hypothetical protein
LRVALILPTLCLTLLVPALAQRLAPLMPRRADRERQLQSIRIVHFGLLPASLLVARRIAGVHATAEAGRDDSVSGLVRWFRSIEEKTECRRN